MVTAYHRDDPGAPAPAYWGYESGEPGFAAVKQLLKACLVFGYGSKAAAGWELIAEGSNYLILRNGTHTGYVCLSFLWDYTVAVYLAETYTGVVGGIMTGDGLKSGTASGTSAPQRINIGLIVAAAATSSWYIVADAATFVFMAGGSYTLTEASNDNTFNTWKPLYVGEDSSGNFIAIGGDNLAADSKYTTSFFASYGFTALKDPDTGFLIGAGSVAPSIPGLDTARDQSVWRRQSILSLYRAPLGGVSWGKLGSVAAGELRGIAMCPALVCVATSQAAQSLGFSGPLTVRTLNTPLDLGDEHTYFMGVASSGCPTFLVTDNPVFW